MSTNADKLQALINATPYHWPTNKLAKEIGITTGSAHRAYQDDDNIAIQYDDAIDNWRANRD